MNLHNYTLSKFYQSQQLRYRLLPVRLHGIGLSLLDELLERGERWETDLQRWRQRERQRWLAVGGVCREQSEQRTHNDENNFFQPLFRWSR